MRCSSKQDQCKDQKIPSIREIKGLEGGSLLCITELSTAVIQTEEWDRTRLVSSTAAY